MEVLHAFTLSQGDCTPSRFGWLSPTISSDTHNRDQTLDDDCSYGFEFLATSNAALDWQPSERMCAADELFFDGKLLPLYVPRRKGRQDVSPCPPLHDQLEESPSSIAKRLSYDSSRCSSISFQDARDTARRSSITLSSPRCASTSRFSSSLPPTTAISPKPPQHASNRFNNFLKLHKMHIPTTSKEVPLQGISRDQSVSSNCKLPISPRSFWPFFRSNSAKENKTYTSHPNPPPTSNSAGDTKTPTLTVLASKNEATIAFNSSGKQNPVPCPAHSSRRTPQSRVSDVTSRRPPPLSFYAPSVDETPSLLLPRAEVVDIASCVQGNAKQLDRARDTRRNGDATTGLSPGKPKGCVSPGRMQRRVVSSPARNFARASPGSRGVWNSPGTGGTGRVVVRNLERRGDGPKGVGRPHDLRNTWQGSHRPNSHSVNVRVVPILNVPVCMGPSIMSGKASKIRLFNLPRLFFKKEKSSKVCSRVPNNWQNGA